MAVKTYQYVGSGAVIQGDIETDATISEYEKDGIIVPVQTSSLTIRLNNAHDYTAVAELLYGSTILHGNSYVADETPYEIKVNGMCSDIHKLLGDIIGLAIKCTIELS